VNRNPFLTATRRLSDLILLGPDPIPRGGHFTVSIDPQPGVQTPPLLLESSVDIEAVGIERGALPCGRPPDFLYPEQVAQCATDDPEMNASEQVESPTGDVTCNISDKNHPPEQGLEPHDPSSCPAAEQAHASMEEETDDPLAQFRAWRRRVASYALKIRTGVLPVQVDDLLGRLRDGDTQSPVTREEVEEVVSTLTRTLIGGTAPKKRVEGKGKKRTKKVRSNHAARKRTMYARCQDLYRRRSQRLVEWAVSDQSEETMTRDRPTEPLKPSILASGVRPADAISQYHQVCPGRRGKF
jgi:hypothetical protein